MSKKAAVFIMLGQSNAVGHDVPMEAGDIIKTPLKNVFGLNRENNQSFENKQLRWSGYTSFGMNLAEAQDNTYSVVNCLAALWQQRIDTGADLPDLYIIQIAIGAEGVTEKFMWYPEREIKLIPGALGEVDISLFPYSMHIFSLLDDSFNALGTEYEIIGLHWRGGEEEITVEIEKLQSDLEAVYRRLFASFNEVLGSPPIVLHRICCPDRAMDIDPSGKALERMEYINSVFEKLCRSEDNISMLDVRRLPQYIPDVRGNGIFKADAVHFTPEANRAIAEIIINDYI